MSDKQLSRVAGCPRLPLPVFRAAAEQYFVGPEATRAEQQNGKKSKVKLLRELSTNDPAVRSWLIKFAKEYKADQTRKIAAEQGLTIAADGGRPLSLIDRMVACLEAGKGLEGFTAEEPGVPDPKHDALWTGYTRHLETGSMREPTLHGCNTCGFNNGPATRVINGAHFCHLHGAAMPIATVSNSTEPASPVPTVSDPTGRIAVLQALRHAQAAYPASDGRPMVGPVGADAVFVNCR